MDSIQEFFDAATLRRVITALIILVVGFIVARLASRGVITALRRQLSPQQAMLTRRGVFYLVAILSFFTALQHVGFDLSILLGAAGILTVALGFASQTSASNLISGLFLIGERPFVVGDTVRIGTTTGEVLSIDLMSVKLRTFDNLFVRVPNETLIKSEITNLTHFPIRRFDLQLGVAYGEDLRRVKDVLFAVAEGYPLTLEEPRPTLLFVAFADSAVQLQFSVWAARENHLTVRTELPFRVKEGLDAADIEIPFPHRTLYTGKHTDPLPVRTITSEPRTEAETAPQDAQSDDA